MLAALALATALTVSGILSWLLANARGYWLVPDMPNDRSLHTRPTPRTGGIAMLLGSGAGLFAAWLWQGIVIIGLPLTISILVLAVVALVDDRRNP
jgi:UDP-N-acetylmuramyl pentapeptide phosphotransferase/UDP-N-acetylglucosamine-1-phosphate transferase